MIKTLKITNFQSHKNTSLSFHKGVNVIIGSSDSGKSALIRALRWLIKNKPSGDSFRSTWGGATGVEMDVGTKKGSTEILRAKTDSKNYYAIKGEEIKAFGQDVPSEVQATLNFSDINIQYQMDSPFILSSSPGEVARLFNQTAHLDSIDTTLSRIESRKRSARNKIEVGEEDIKKRKEELKSFSSLEKIEKKIEALADLEKEIEQIERTERTISKLIGQIELLEEDQKKYAVILSKEEKINQALNIQKEIEAVEKKKEAIENIIYQIETTDNLLTTAVNKWKSLEKDFKKMMPEICPLCGREGNDKSRCDHNS